MTSPLFYLFVFALLVTASYEDVKTREISLWLINATLVIGALNIVLCWIEARIVPWNLIIGAFVLSVPMLVVAVVSNGGIGGADIRIIAGVGAVTGVVTLLPIYLVSAVCCVVWTVSQWATFKWKCRKMPVEEKASVGIQNKEIPYLLCLMIGYTLVVGIQALLQSGIIV